MVDDGKQPTLEDIIGLEHTKLGFFSQARRKMAQLEAANHRLKRKRQKLEAILDGISDVMVVISLNFTIISVNRLFSQIFGVERPEGQPCYAVLKKRTAPCSDCPLTEARTQKQVFRQTRVYPINDEKRQFEVSVSPMADSRQKIFRFLVIMRDVTREKTYQENYYYSQKMATVGLLAAGVAHEINNPLTAISGFSEGLKRRMPKLRKALEDQGGRASGSGGGTADLAGDFEEYIDTIMAECHRCRDIVKNLLTFSPRKRIDFARVDLIGLVTDVLKLLHYRIRQNPGLAFDLNFDPRARYVRGNAPELKQVLLNIICNAMDAIEMAAQGDGGTAPGIDKDEVRQGSLKIFTRPQENWTTLSIQDNGCGICKPDMERLFDPFFTTKPLGRGTGIGLSTCYNIIQQHQGEIQVTSWEGEGATFTIKLPRTGENNGE